MQYRDKAAERAGEIIARDGLQIIPSLVGGFFRLLDDEEWNTIVTGKATLSLPARPVSTPERKVRWVTNQKSGIPKIIKLVEMLNLSGHFQQALEAACPTDQEILRWIAAFPAGHA